MANKFEIRIGAVDGVTKVANRISRSIEGITAPYTNLRKSLKTLGDSSGVGKLNDGLSKVADTARNVADRIASIVPGLTAITGALSLVGIGKLAADWGAFGFSLSKTSRALGMSTSDLQAWHIAAQKSGVTASEFDSSISSSQNTIRDARYGKNPEALMLMQRMGVQIAANRDGTIDYLTTQQRLMAAIGRQRSPVTQRNVAGALEMEGMLPMIQRGTYGQDLANARSSGQIMSPAQIKSAEQFEDRIISLKQSLTNLGYSIGNAVTPPLQNFVESMTSFFNDNKAQIVDTIGGAFKQIAEWIKSVDWKGVATDIGNMVTQIGGVKGIAVAIAAITFAGPIGGLLTLTSSLISLTTITVPAAIKALARLGGARAAAAAGAEAVAAGGGSAAVGGAGSIALTVTSTIAALAALGYLSYETYKHRNEIGVIQAENTPPAFGGGGDGKSVGRWGKIGDWLGINGSTGQRNAQSTALFSRLESQYKLPSGLLDSVWAAESGRGVNMLSPKGAKGHFGFMDPTAAQYGLTDPNDLNASATAAARMYSDLLRANGGNLDKALAAYNWGQGNLNASGLAGAPRETQDYIAKVESGMGLTRATSAPAAIAGASSQQFENDRETRAPIYVEVHNALPGTKVDARGADGSYMPTKINYSMGNPSYGALP
ncbi:transglycosylase SLT domain-containing protein [Paraburkholderia fungorum]